MRQFFQGLLAGLLLGALGMAPAKELACALCHAPQVQALVAGPHGQIDGDETSRCASCHGQLGDHAQHPMNEAVEQRFGGEAGLNAAAASAVCLRCHEGARTLMHWDAGRHRQAQVGCTDCHSVHSAALLRSHGQALVETSRLDPSINTWVSTSRRLEAESCVRCHQAIRVQMNKFSHHPIMEGKLACTDCHNPHGSLSAKLLKADDSHALCLDCHANKRGPFMWPHPPAEENCLSCHSPHGSNHERLLNQKMPGLCQDCHDGSRHPGSFYGADQSFAAGQNTRLVGRSCINCHQLVHGSNAPGSRGRFFTR